MKERVSLLWTKTPWSPDSGEPSGICGSCTVTLAGNFSMLGPFHLHQGLFQGLLLRAAVRSAVSGAEYMPHTCWQGWRTQSQSFTQGISIRQHGEDHTQVYYWLLPLGVQIQILLKENNLVTFPTTVFSSTLQCKLITKNSPWEGGPQWGDLCTPVADSWWCTAETNTVL